jgi:DNA transformation protein
MFLGWGLSVDGMTVAVIAWDTLFLKADSESAPYFVAAGCRIFEYTGKGRVRRMGYYSAIAPALVRKCTAGTSSSAKFAST